ncbi:putative two-component sensor protein histidine protein kinase [Immersiella caudata]|uniref:Two-component sensor protein histidine protein kinase n=1 Tax=Immersiella caudata TaxID=314043 RepID=A0AA39XG20_9PEZI|nr:putative two-component sensor protein histidine protein kinase [Immersiella caudata]
MPVYLDTLGQQPTLNIYTQLSLAFGTPPDYHDSQAVVTTLTAGLERLTSVFPWTAGKIVVEQSEKHSSGIFKIVEWASTPQLVVRDLRGDPSMPTMDSLKKANFAMNMLDESIFASHPTLPGGIAGDGPEPTAVFGIQICFIKGGLVLTFVGHHQAMDFVGLVQVMRLLDKACRGDPFSASDISTANFDRRTTIPLLDSQYQPGSEVERQICNPTRDASAVPVVPRPSAVRWAYFSFSPSALAALKITAMETATHAYVSTDDALTAFIWLSVARARQDRIRPDVEVTLGRAVDGRRYLNLPREYPGMLNSMVYFTHYLGDLVSKPLGDIATKLRLAVDPDTSEIGDTVRGLATMFDRTPDRSLFSASAKIDPSRDLMISSWASPDCYGMSFGLDWGLPVAVRRPRFVPVEGLGYLLPKHPEEGITVAICLAENDLRGLMADELFSRLATYVG